MKILWIVPKWTFPINDGARIATDRLLRAVAAAGAEIDVVAICAKHEMINVTEMRTHWPVSRVVVLRRSMPQTLFGKVFYYAWQLLTRPRLPLTFSSFASLGITQGLRDLLATSKYDLVLFDGLHTAVPLLQDLSRRDRRVRFVLRAHNVETDLWEKASELTSVLPKKWLLRQQALKVKKIEQLVLRQVDGIAAIAKEDLARFLDMTQKVCAYVPLGLSFSSPLSHEGVDENEFLFVGRLDWPPNRDGLEWLLKNVWSAVKARRPKARLTIAGVGDASWLDQYRTLEGINFLGRVESVTDVYQSAAFAVAPLFYGSGTRIKIVESFAMNRSLISTAMGVQGAEVESDMYFNAESVDQWIEVMSEVKLDKAALLRLEIARDRMKSKFEESQVGQTAYEWIQTLL